MFNQPKRNTKSSAAGFTSQPSSQPVRHSGMSPISLSSLTETSSPSIEQALLQTHFKCPILQQKMRDPVIAADGHTYEHEAIAAWIKSRGARAISPMTGAQLEHLELTPNIVLHQMITAYQDSKPQRKQRELTQRDILLAIQLREEELRALLSKREKSQKPPSNKDRTLSTHQSKSQTEKPLASKYTQKEKNRLSKTTNAERGYKLGQPSDDKGIQLDKNFMDYQSKLRDSEEQLQVLAYQKATNTIQQFFRRTLLKKTLRGNWLYKEHEALLETQKQLESELQQQQTTCRLKINELMSQEQWAQIGTYTQQAEAASASHAEKSERLVKKPIQTLVFKKQQKLTAVKNQADHLLKHGLLNRKYQQDIAKVTAEQVEIGLSFSHFLTERSQNIQVKRNGKSVLKNNEGLSELQKKHQNQLNHACCSASTEEVKKLVEAADPTISNDEGEYPLAAAIWGLSPDAIDYLQQKANYTDDDWRTVAKFLQEKHGAVLPYRKEIKTSRDLMDQRKDTPWLFYIKDTFSRSKQLEPRPGLSYDSPDYVTTMHEDHISTNGGPRIRFSIYTPNKKWTFNEGGYDRHNQDHMEFIVSPSGYNNGLPLTTFNSVYYPKTQIEFLKNICSRVAEQLHAHGILLTEDNQLIDSVLMMNPTP